MMDEGTRATAADLCLHPSFFILALRGTAYIKRPFRSIPDLLKAQFSILFEQESRSTCPSIFSERLSNQLSLILW